MPFLFVDYDQGAGGEYFCANLSKSPQCNLLESILTDKNRTKVNDIFEQEFLKLVPRPKKISSGFLYDVVPTHRHTPLAKQLLDNVVSIRISNPQDPNLLDYLNFQRIHKVVRAPLPSARHFIGELDNLIRVAKNTAWVKNAKISMDYIDLILLTYNIENNEENKIKYIEQHFSSREPEPEFDYTLIIPYEDLFFNIKKIKENLKETFNIDVVGDWLETYKENYNVYLSTS